MLAVLIGLTSAPCSQATITEFQVNTYTTYDQQYPSVAMGANGNFVIAWSSFGQDGDCFGVFMKYYPKDRPGIVDFDGDAKTDIAVRRPESGVWYVTNSKDESSVTHQWGEGSQNDVPVPGDYDGDGKTDIAVWRPAYGYWFIINSSNESITFKQWGEGAQNDEPTSP